MAVDMEEIERDIRIAIWNGARWQGSPQEVAQSLIRKIMDEPCMKRVLAALTKPAALPKEGEEEMCWFCDEDGAPCGYPPVVGTGTDARCEKHHEPLALAPPPQAQVE